MMSFLSEDTPYLNLVVGFTVAITALHLYLDTRQKKALQQPKPPAGGRYTAAQYKKVQAYQLDKLSFGMARTAFDSVTSVLCLMYAYYPATWRAAGRGVRALAAAGVPVSGGEIWQSIAWVLLLAGVDKVLSLPWSAYSTFVVEARHGFNKTSARTFVLDIFKSLALTAALAPPIVAAITYILQHTGPKMALYLWAFLFALALVMMTVYPVLIAPLFNKYSPLPEGPLRTSIEALAASLSFPLKRLYVVDGSTRSAHSNAYMYGLFSNKRIVLYDTLLEQCGEAQVVAVLAHELGHWKLRHTPALFASHQLILGAQLALFAAAKGAPGLYEAFGFVPGERPALAALVLFQLMTGPLDELLSLGANVVSRAFEFQADRFGVGLGHGEELRAALVTLDRENKGAPHVDPLYSAYHFSHPPLPERLGAIDAELKRRA